ncbi:MAG: copper homeostasis protein CutC [Verrucomicrobia bacterium]|nr:copper homeostasis protein CutC [Verrucomicrobiota bacterium]
MTLEICVDTLASVDACARAGADRIELCAALVEGGTTPSIGFLHAARRRFPGKIMAMLRPRAGDFVYSAAEFDLMLDEIDFLRREGADGIVFGMLTPDGTIDSARSQLIVARAAGLDLTFHRAFDVSRDLSESLEALIALGVPRVLTSGGHPNVMSGMAALTHLASQAAGRIALLPGGGVKPENIAEIIRRTGVTEVHLSARVSVPSTMRHRRPDLPLGAATVPGEYEHKTASTAIIRAARQAMLA